MSEKAIRITKRIQELHQELSKLQADLFKEIAIMTNTQRTPRTIATIQEIVAQTYDVPTSMLSSPSRLAMYALPRAVAMFLCREFTQHSMSTISTAFAKKDHGTCAAAISKIAHQCTYDKKLAASISELRSRIKSHLENEETPLFVQTNKAITTTVASTTN